MVICDHWSKDPPGLHCEPTGLHCELQNFDLNVDPDPAFHSNADPDPASKNNAGPDPQPSTSRPKHSCFGTGSGLGLDPDQIQTGKKSYQKVKKDLMLQYCKKTAVRPETFPEA
jgi:hypothetical protein